MVGIDDAITGVSSLLNNAINKIWPNPEDKAKADAMEIIAAANAAVEQLKASQAVMLAEEQSEDPWTSRARPSFLYVIYLLILASIPMGILFAFKPDVANAVIQGFHNWLSAIPDAYINLFGIGYLGYTGGRSWDKHTEAKFSK
jgi:hypothetical protein